MRFLVALCFLSAVFAADPAYPGAQAKVDKLVDGHAMPGEVIFLSAAEVNAWVAVKTPKEIPAGIRDPRVELGTDTASASAMVDFVKIQQSRGKQVGLVMSMFQGERPLKISVRVASYGGKITVFLTRVEMSGYAVEGAPLDLLLKNFFHPLYPDAKIGEPVDLDYNIDNVQIRPDGVRIVIKK